MPNIAIIICLAACTISLTPRPAEAQGLAAEFTGSTRVEISAEHTIGQLSHRTFEAWVKVPARAGTYTIYSEDNGANNHYPIFAITIELDPQLRGLMGVATWRSGNWSGAYTEWGVVEAERWTHLAWRLSPDGGPVFFVDGLPQTCSTGVSTSCGGVPTTLAPQGRSTLFFGASCAGPGLGLVGAFEGLVRDVRLWNVARTPCEIAASRFELLAPPPGLIARYPLEGDLLDAVGTRHGSPCGPVNFLPLMGTGFPTPSPTTPTFSAEIDARNLVQLRLSYPMTTLPDAPVVVWMNSQLGQVPLLHYGYSQVALSLGAPLVTIADPCWFFGRPLEPTSALNSCGVWSFEFPSALLHYIYGFGPQRVYFDAYVVDPTAVNGLFHQFPIATVFSPGLL